MGSNIEGPRGDGCQVAPARAVLLSELAAHEINNPAAFVLLNLQVLRERFLLLVSLLDLHTRGAAPAQIEDFRRANGIEQLLADVPHTFDECLAGMQRIEVLTRALRPPKSPEVARAAAVSPPATPPRATEARPGRVLVIDDEQGMVNSIRRVLHKHEVITARGGQEALEIIARDQRFDLVLCDLMMPEMTGMELFEQTAPKFPGLADRFVFMTGSAYTTDAQEFCRRVVNRKIDKPIANEKLIELVGEAIGQGAGQDKNK
jgi:CheY-like chemotaxis protein